MMAEQRRDLLGFVLVDPAAERLDGVGPEHYDIESEGRARDRARDRDRNCDILRPERSRVIGRTAEP
jgi:hypothetical protein